MACVVMVCLAGRCMPGLLLCLKTKRLMTEQTISFPVKIFL